VFPRDQIRRHTDTHTESWYSYCTGILILLFLTPFFRRGLEVFHTGTHTEHLGQLFTRINHNRGSCKCLKLRPYFLWEFQKGPLFWQFILLLSLQKIGTCSLNLHACSILDQYDFFKLAGYFESYSIFSIWTASQTVLLLLMMDIDDNILVSLENPDNSKDTI
jgi:hypothetical protein